MSTTRVVVPVGMLGAGFPEDSVAQGIARGAHAIAVDGGSTDSGPYYLGAAEPKTTKEAVTRDLRPLLVAGKQAGVPVIVGSCGTSGTDAGVDWVAGIVWDIARQENLALRVASIKSEVPSTGSCRTFPPAGFVRLHMHPSSTSQPSSGASTSWG